MAFYVGQKVDLVVDFGPHERSLARAYDLTLPAPGVVYTVRALDFGTHLRVAEIVNPMMPYVEGDHEAHFMAARFRPVVERKTDISELTAILNGKRIQLPDLVEEEARSSLADRFVGTVGVLAGGLGICWAVMLAEFWGMV